mgnify:CR=1 FL=1
MKISVVGLGKLGAPLAAVLSGAGHSVIGIDNNPSTVEQINQMLAPVPEPGLQGLLSKFPFPAYTDYFQINETDLTIIIVPTPSGPDGGFVNDYVLAAIDKVGEQLRYKNSYHTVVIASTLMPGSCEKYIVPALEEASGIEVGEYLGFCYSPEFIALGSVVNDLSNPDMVLIGQVDDRSGASLQEVMEEVVRSSVPFYRLTLTEAELAKIAVNSYITMKISFANTIGEMCESYDNTEASNVVNAIGADARIGVKYLAPATAYGGPCFPRDQRAFAKAAQEVGVDALLSGAADGINQRQIQRVTDLATKGIRTGSKIAILGLSYKSGTPVSEESAGMLISRELEERGYRVEAYDPLISPGTVSLGSVLADAEVAVITIPENDFSFLPDFEGRVIDCWGVCTNPNTFRIGVGA